MLLRFALLLLACCAPAFAWTESVEFPWNTYPRHLWERELVWLKNIGIRHVSLPPGNEDVVAIVRRLGLEADLESAVPAAYESLSTRHGGPLTDPLPNAPRISVLSPGALLRARELFLSGAAGIVWTDVEDTLGPDGYKAGAVSFGGQERAATATLRRSAKLSLYWSSVLKDMHELPGAGTRLPAEAITVTQYSARNGMSLVNVVNASSKSWTGDIRAMYQPLQRVIVVPNVTVGAKDSAWLPMDIPLTASALCRDCSGFAPTDHVIYATAEITTMEYENGILALEFSSPGKGEVVLQLTREPSGPLVAGGHPAEVDWDEKALRARLGIPAGSAAAHHVRIGLAIEPPDSTAFFDAARVLLIGETNRLKAQFSSEEVAGRSRLRIAPPFGFTSGAGKVPLDAEYAVNVPASAVHGDRAELALEADGSRLSHTQPQLLLPATVRFPDAIAVRVAQNSSLALYPAVIPFHQKAGREFTVTLRNNAAEIRTFQVSATGAGLEFSPPQTVTVGVSDARDVTFRVFPTGLAAGLYNAEVRIGGAVHVVEPVRFLVVPQSGEVAWSTEGFSFLESNKVRASFWGARWLEHLNKDSGVDSMPAGGIPAKIPASLAELPKR